MRVFSVLLAVLAVSCSTNPPTPANRMLKLTISGKTAILANATSDRVFIIEQFEGAAVQLGRHVLTERADIRMMVPREPLWFPDVEGYSPEYILLPGGKCQIELAKEPSQREFHVTVVSADIGSFRAAAMLCPAMQRYYQDQEPEMRAISQAEWDAWLKGEPPGLSITFEGCSAGAKLPEGFNRETHVLIPGE